MPTKRTDSKKPERAGIPSREARRQFGDLLSRAGYGRERIPVSLRGKPLVALVPIADLEFLEKHAPAA